MSLKNQEQQHYYQQGCSMGVATICIKWKTSHALKLNNFEVKARTTIKNQDDLIIVRVLGPSSLYTFVLGTFKFTHPRISILHQPDPARRSSSQRPKIKEIDKTPLHRQTLRD